MYCLICHSGFVTTEVPPSTPSHPFAHASASTARRVRKNQFDRPLLVLSVKLQRLLNLDTWIHVDPMFSIYTLSDSCPSNCFDKIRSHWSTPSKSLICMKFMIMKEIGREELIVSFPHVESTHLYYLSLLLPVSIQRMHSNYLASKIFFFSNAWTPLIHPSISTHFLVHPNVPF